MEKIKKYIPKIILLDTMLYTLIIVTLYFILSSFKLMFREWIYIVSAVIIIGGFVAGIIQLLSKIKEKVLRNVLIGIVIILLLLSTPAIFFLGAFSYTPEHIVRKDGNKYVAYVNGFLRTYVSYYDYKNIFVVGNQKRIEEDYGKGGFDPIENKFGNKYDVEMTTYYDEDGNVVSRENTKSDNQIQETEIENITNNIEETYNGIITNINSNTVIERKGGRNKIEQLKDADLNIIKIRLDKNTINNEIPIATYFMSSDGN